MAFEVELQQVLGIANLKMVANVDVILHQSLSGKVLTEHSPYKIQIGKLIAPVIVMFFGIRIYRLVHSAMYCQISLSVTIEISFLTITGLLTGSLKIPVVTVCPLNSTLFGRPTFTESTFI